MLLANDDAFDVFRRMGTLEGEVTGRDDSLFVVVVVVRVLLVNERFGLLGGGRKLVSNESNPPCPMSKPSVVGIKIESLERTDPLPDIIEERFLLGSQLLFLRRVFSRSRSSVSRSQASPRRRSSAGGMICWTSSEAVGCGIEVGAGGDEPRGKAGGVS